MLHRFHVPIDHIALPTRFTYPFCYTPHPLCLIASYEVQEYLKQQTQWKQELDAGKMFGVLVVRTADGQLGYLAAFSGILAGKNMHPFFVPPVYDLLQPDGFFKIEEEQISQLNARIDAMQTDEQYIHQKNTLLQRERAVHKVLDDAKTAMREARLRREERRKEASLTPKGRLAPDEEAALIRESQFQKAEYKRLEKRLSAWLDASRNLTNEAEEKMACLRSERRQRSAALQRRLFDQFTLLNAKGERKSLHDIFIQDFEARWN